MSEQTDLWREDGGEVLLRGMRCKSCGSILFPPQPYGCEACGADSSSLEEVEFPSRGTLHSFTTVYVHSKIETPYQVAEVQTAARQFVRARLEHPDPRVGDDVTGSIRTTGDAAQFVFEPAS